MKILFTTTFLLIGISSGLGQSPVQSKQDTSVHKVTDATSLQFFDEQGQKIDKKQFGAAIRGGQYSFRPKMEDGKMIALQLKKNDKVLKIGSEAPDFTVADLSGKIYKLSDLKGKTVVLNFWFTTCAPCITEMPELNNLVDKYKNDDHIVFLSVTYNTAEAVKTFLTKTAFNYLVAPGQRPLIDQYGIVAYPTNLIIDKNGHVAFLLSGYSTGNVGKIDAAIRSWKKFNLDI